MRCWTTVRGGVRRRASRGRGRQRREASSRGGERGGGRGGSLGARARQGAEPGATRRRNGHVARSRCAGWVNELGLWPPFLRFFLENSWRCNGVGSRHLPVDGRKLLRGAPGNGETPPRFPPRCVLSLRQTVLCDSLELLGLSTRRPVPRYAEAQAGNGCRSPSFRPPRVSRWSCSYSWCAQRDLQQRCAGIDCVP